MVFRAQAKEGDQLSSVGNKTEEELAGGRVGSAHPSAGPKHILAKCLFFGRHHLCAHHASIHPS